ncbi:MAG: hypothetical protein HQK72_08750 [Desulfamplus sp.]|nr:hypothetical protein [Desulfamplus sp.]
MLSGEKCLIIKDHKGLSNMTYLQKLRKEFGDFQIFKDEIKNLEDMFKLGNYFQLIIIAPQLLEKIVAKIDENGSEYIIRKMGEPDKDTLEVGRLYNKLIQEETIKARVALYLVDLFENDYSEYSFSKKEFVKYFTKLESIIACRNDLAHEYYKRHISSQKIKRAAKESLELVELMSLHPSLSY